jgi:poly(3-hydroxybutyrate) depolymerase
MRIRLSTTIPLGAALFVFANPQISSAQMPPLSPAAGVCPAPARAGGAAGAPASTPRFPGIVLDQSMGSGDNYEAANFRLWIPESLRTVRAVLVLSPGSNGDGRNQVMDSTWEAYAIENQLALVGVSFQDKAPRGIFENYVDVARGSGDAFLGAIRSFARESGHTELATAPFLLWGMSAGGELNYEMTLWKPERVVAFIVNKGGIYWHALASTEARAVPGILFAGGTDLDSRIGTIFGLFALNRRGGALWSFSVEPCAGHVVGKSQALAMMFYADMLKARLDGAPLNADGAPKLNALTEQSGLIGNITDFTFGPAAARVNTNVSTSWLPNERIARGWQAIAKGEAVVP